MCTGKIQTSSQGFYTLPKAPVSTGGWRHHSIHHPDNAEMLKLLTLGLWAQQQRTGAPVRLGTGH